MDNNGVGLYDWPVDPWQRDVVPFIEKMRDELGIPRRITEVQLR